MDRNIRLDWLRAMSIVAVLIIHSSTRYTVSGWQQSIGGWFDLFSRPCIAIFLFLAGYFFRTKELNLAYLIIKYQRVLVPYLMFSGLAFLYQEQAGLVSYLSNNMVEVVGKIVLGGAWGIYYYIFVIAYTYLLGYIVLKQNSKKWLVYVTIFFLVFHLLHNAYFFSIADRYHLDPKLIDLYTNRYLSWPFYFFLGVTYKVYYFIEHKLNENRQYLLLLWLGLFFFYNFLYWFNIDDTNGYNSIIGTVYSTVTIFMLLTINFKENFMVRFISRISYTIYLSHFFFVKVFEEFVYKMELTDQVFMNSFVSIVFSLTGSILFYQIIHAVFPSRSKQLIGA